MRKALLRLCLLAFLCLAATARAQQPDDKEVRLSLTFADEPLSEALLRLEKASPYHFLLPTMTSRPTVCRDN